MTEHNSNEAIITVGDQTTSLPIIQATDGHSALDISKLSASTGLNTFDLGFVNTAVTRSAITFIDGDKGILRYRGYPIEELAGQKSFLENAYLLIYGELPSASESVRGHGAV